MIGFFTARSKGDDPLIRRLDLCLIPSQCLCPCLGAYGSEWGCRGRYLFPSPDGGARSYSAMRDALGRSLRKHAGISLSPHLYRHIIAKIVVERHPELICDVSRRLGHASVNTTYQSYLGTEGPAASRRINELLQTVRADDGKIA